MYYTIYYKIYNNNTPKLVDILYSLGYLTPHQSRIWDLRRLGGTQTSIGKRFGISRQAVNRNFEHINRKLTNAFQETAKVNRISFKGDVDVKRGLAFGYSHPYQMNAIIVYSIRHGIQIWYEKEANCKQCPKTNECKTILLDTYKEQDIPLPSQSDIMNPNELANHLFTNLKQQVRKRET